MTALLVAIPLLGLLVMLQSAIVSQMPLIHGTADLVLLALLAWAVQERVTTAWLWTLLGGLLVTMVSALPLGVVLLGYLISTGFALIIKRRLWQIPLLAMMVTTIIGTLVTHSMAVLSLQTSGSAFQWQEGLHLVTLPSVLLNLLFAIPIYAVFSDLAKWIYPPQIEI